LIANCTDVDLPLCAAWKTSGITIAGRQDAASSAELDALHEPMGLYAAKDGSLYVADHMNDRIMMYNPSSGGIGTPIGDGRGTSSPQLHKPTSVLLDPTTNTLYIVDGENGRIQRWNEGGLGTDVKTVFGQLRKNSTNDNARFLVHDIQLDPHLNSTLYISDVYHGRVIKWDLQASRSEIVVFKLSKPLGIHIDMQRNVYVAECGNSQISKWSRGTLVAGTRWSGNIQNRLNCSSAITVDPDSGMFIVDTNNHRILRWQLNSLHGKCLIGCSAARGNAAHQLAEPQDITFDWKGNLLVADTGNNRVQRFDMYIDTLCGKYRVVIHQCLTCITMLWKTIL
jgi:sugar lactone lactonase YvrE